MKARCIPVVVVLLFAWTTAIQAQDADCWHYENGDANLIVSMSIEEGALGVEVSGDYAYVITPDELLAILVTSDPVNSVLVDALGDFGGPVNTGIAVAGDHAYIASFLFFWGSFGSMTIVDISDPHDLVIVSETFNSLPCCSTGGVMVAGGYAFATYSWGCEEGEGGVTTYIYDVTDPTNPVHVSTLDFILGIRGPMTVAGDYLYTPYHIIDISNILVPEIVGTIDPGGAATIAVSGYYVFLAGEDFKVFDVSDPTDPFSVVMLDLPGFASSITIDGDFAYLTAEEPGLLVVDISDPVAPVLLGGVDTPGVASDVSVSEDFVILADSDAGMQVAWKQCEEDLDVAIDIKPGSDTNPVNCLSGNGVIPVAILTTDDFDATTVDHVTVRFGPDQASEAHENSQGPIRHEADVDDDGDTDLMFHFRFGETGIQCGDTEATLTGQTFEGTDITGSDQLRTVTGHRDDHSMMRLARIVPNPFNPQTTIEYQVPVSGRVSVQVFDLGGRLITTLVDEFLPAGRHEVVWQGVDDLGRHVASGTYFCRLQAGGGVETTRMVLVK